MPGQWRLKWCSFLVSIAVLSLSICKNVEAVEAEASTSTSTPSGSASDGDQACSGKPNHQHRFVC